MLSKKSFIQIAGVKNYQEAQMLVACGVDYIGFPLQLEYHLEDLGEVEVAEIIRKLPPTTQGVLITYLKETEKIIELSSQLNVKTIQLHGDVSLGELRILKSQHPELQIIKSLIIGKTSEQIILENIRAYTPWVDAFLLDTFAPETGASGATGKTHNWGLSSRLVEISKLPIILAGGLKAENVHQAILTVKPAGVDVHTGVENRNGNKDLQLVGKFVSEAKKAFRRINQMNSQNL
jgi:phosphoribosylanthranilate isomerase